MLHNVHVMKIVIQIVNSIGARPFQRRFFKILTDELKCKYCMELLMLHSEKFDGLVWEKPY